MQRTALSLCFVFLLVASTFEPSKAAHKGFANTPLRGWSSWSFFWNKHVSESAVEQEADAMAEKLKSSGFMYVNIDSGWAKGYDNFGRTQWNASRFPHGMKALADYVHGKGLKFGIYMQPGLPKNVWNANTPIYGTSYTAREISDGMTEGNTSGNAWSIDFTKPGSDAYIQSLVDQFAMWGVDYIKLDFVGPGGGNVRADNREELKHWATAIKKSRRHIWLELSNSLSIENVPVWAAYSNGWRIGNDIENYSGESLTTWGTVLDRFTNVAKWAPYAGPGHWNDLDSLEIGNGEKDGLTFDERKSAMTLWCINCAPLLLGSDLRTLDPDDLKILTNPEILAVQAAGRVAIPLSQDKPQQIWRVQNRDLTYTIALFNLADSSATMSVMWSELGINSVVEVRDLWRRQDLGQFDSQFSATVPGHGVVLLRVTPT